ncbi:6670_t:CDS:2, partial [Dentiscutata erythropus]
LEQDLSLAQNELSEIESLEREFEQEKILLSAENTTLNYKKMELEETLSKERNKLMQIKDNLASAQKALLEKDSLFQETNAHLAEQILKVFSELKYNEVIGGVSRLEKAECGLYHNNDITNHILSMAHILLYIFFYFTSQ